MKTLREYTDNEKVEISKCVEQYLIYEHVESSKDEVSDFIENYNRNTQHACDKKAYERILRGLNRKWGMKI